MALITSFSGIRGIYGKDLTEDDAIRYAYSYLSFLKDKTGKNAITIVIGMDTRTSGAKLSDAITGILDCNFIKVGILPTPAIEFAVRHFGADGGIIITASHNEPYWNGFKFLNNDGAVLRENEMSTVIRNSNHFKNFNKIQDRNIVEKHDEAVKRYSDFLFDIIGALNIRKIKASKQKIVIDPNGGAGIVAKNILEQIGADVISLNMQPGEFNRTVEPTEDSLVYLKAKVDENNADFAAGFDCDADRLEILMDNGKLVSGHYILAIVVNEMLSMHDNPKGQTVIVNDATSNIVRDIAEKFGAKVKEVEVGETNVVEEMKKSKSIVGGEGSSGGAIIAPSRCRDGILTLLLILSIIAKKQKKLREIIEEFPKYYTLRKKIGFDPGNHDKIKNFIKNYYLKKGFEIKETGGIKGGLKAIKGKSAFAWFRASKTEAGIFRIISDSNKEVEAKQLLDEAVQVFENAQRQ